MYVLCQALKCVIFNRAVFVAGVLDLQGDAGGLVEDKASLLASHGFAA